MAVRRVLAALAGMAAFVPGGQVPVGATVEHGPRPQSSQPSLRVVTFNVFQDLSPAQHRQDWEHLKSHADVVLLQETQGFRVSAMVTGPAWTVIQAEGVRGESSVVVRRSAVRSVARSHVRWMLGLHECRGAGIGARYLVSAVLVLRDGSRLRVASTHLPHAGCADAVYDEMVRHVQKWVQGHPQRLLIGADWNREVASDPGDFRAKTRLRPHGVGIDGFQVDRRLSTRGIRRLGSDEDWVSDHEPVRVAVSS